MKQQSGDSVLGAFCRAAEWALLVLAVGIALAAAVVPRLGDAAPYVVLTGSMRPTMPPGTLVAVRRVDPAALGAGDVITFMPRENDPSVVTHRIVGTGFSVTGEPVFRSKGDANDAVDPAPVRDIQIVGERWYSVPYIGYVTNLLSGSQRETGVHLVAGGLTLYSLAMFAGALLDRSRGGPRSRRTVAHA